VPLAIVSAAPRLTKRSPDGFENPVSDVVGHLSPIGQHDAFGGLPHGVGTVNGRNVGGLLGDRQRGVCARRRGQLANDVELVLGSRSIEKLAIQGHLCRVVDTELQQLVFGSQTLEFRLSLLLGDRTSLLVGHPGESLVFERSFLLSEPCFQVRQFPIPLGYQALKALDALVRFGLRCLDTSGLVGGLVKLDKLFG